MDLSHWVSRFLLDSKSEFTPQHLRPPPQIADYAISLDDYHELPDPCEFMNPGERVRDIRVYKNNWTEEKIIVVTCRKIQSPRENDIFEGQLKRRVKALAWIHHPCVVPLAGYWPPTGNTGPRIAIPFIGPDSLESILSSEESPAWWTATAKTVVIIGIVVGMCLIYSAGHRHQDLQPSNILLDNETHAPMILGIGPKHEDPAGPHLKLSHDSPRYKAPELHAQGQVTEKADVFSFGMILYEIVTGTRVFDQTAEPYQVMRRICQGERPRIPAVRPFTRELITSCWDGNAGTRPSFKEVLRRLRDERFRVFQDVDGNQIDQFERHLTHPENW
jgi:serine/threonine protein kinase